ncbi:hypothetical protein H6P81_004270 [Aristolochia fimbriata]|uniref:Uncharacterized protein n=1 Tax=Aristolochia fimbriata TaxID=158543 RepID=A0AAV7FHG8_ARIFI|nr:hypothetical protein H6P81_004270 [Aristolochia fimbriata]
MGGERGARNWFKLPGQPIRAKHLCILILETKFATPRRCPGRRQGSLRATRSGVGPGNEFPRRGNDCPLPQSPPPSASSSASSSASPSASPPLASVPPTSIILRLLPPRLYLFLRPFPPSPLPQPLPLIPLPLSPSPPLPSPPPLRSFPLPHSPSGPFPPPPLPPQVPSPHLPQEGVGEAVSGGGGRQGQAGRRKEGGEGRAPRKLGRSGEETGEGWGGEKFRGREGPIPPGVGPIAVLEGEEGMACGNAPGVANLVP